MKEKEEYGLTAEIVFHLLAVADRVWNEMIIQPTEIASWTAAEVYCNYKNYKKEGCWIEKNDMDLGQTVSISINHIDGNHNFKMSFRLLDVFDVLGKFEKMQSKYKNIRFSNKERNSMGALLGSVNDAQNWYWCGTSVKLRDGFPESNHDYREPNNKKLHHPVTTIKNGGWYDERVKANEKLLRQQILEKGSRWFFMFNG